MRRPKRLNRFCQSCGAKIETGSLFCTNCGHPIEAAPEKAPLGPAPQAGAQPAKAGGGKMFIFLGCGCLAVIGLVVVLALGGWLGWNRIKGLVIHSGSPADTGTAAPPVSVLDAYTGAWVLESEQTSPDGEDVVIFSIKDGKLVGVSGETGSAHRLELTCGPDGVVSGTASGEGQTELVVAKLSEDHSRLTLTIKPGTDGEQRAVLIKQPWPRPGALTSQTAVATGEITNQDVLGGWVADQGEAGENNVMTFTEEDGAFVGRGGPNGRFTMRLTPGDGGKLQGPFDDGQGNSIPITAELSADKRTLHITFNPPASEPWGATFSRVQ